MIDLRPNGCHAPIGQQGKQVLPILAVMAFLFVGLLPNTLQAQDEPPAEDLTFGFQVFHSILESRGLETTTDLTALQQNPRTGVMILLGDVKQNNLIGRARINEFLSSGGVVLLATDHAVWADRLCVIQRGPAIVSGEHAYQEFTDCPRITSLERSHSLTSGCTELIANRSGWLSELFDQQGAWNIVARLPETDRALIAEMRTRRGRMVAMADHSLLINGMVLHGDNARFMLNLANYLAFDRRRELYIAVDGLPLSAGSQPVDIPDELPPLPPPEELPPINLNDLKNLPAEMWLPFANQALTALEDADLHNELAAERPRDLSDRLYRRLLYFLVGGLIFLFILWQLFKRSQRVEPSAAAVEATRLATRVEQLRARGQLRPAVKGLARDLLRSVSGSERDAAWVQGLPRVRIDAGWITRWRVRDALRQLLGLATSGELSRPMPPHLSRWLSKRIVEISRLDQEGRIHWPAA